MSDLEPILLLVGIGLSELGKLLKRGRDFRHPSVQFVQIVVLQGVLVLGVALPAAHADVLRGLKEKLGARDLRQFDRSIALMT